LRSFGRQNAHPSGSRYVKSHPVFGLLLFPLFASLTACGGGGGSLGSGSSSSSSSSSSSGGSGVFLPASNFDQMCVNPRPGTSDVRGTVTDQNNWLRSWTNDTYLWFSEVNYPNPASYQTAAYFDLLKTNATTASGQAKDKFHFTYDTDEWEALSQGGETASYGALIEVLAPRPPRNIVVAFVQTSTPADGVLNRGDKILQVDGQDAVNGSTQAVVDALNAGLFPDNDTTTHTFLVQNTRAHSARSRSSRSSSSRIPCRTGRYSRTTARTSGTSCSTITLPRPKAGSTTRSPTW
jgi:hypothetical protein